MNEPEETPDPSGEPIAVEASDLAPMPVPFTRKALKLAGQVVRGAIYGVGICAAGLFALGLVVPARCAGAQSSARLKWTERQQLIDQAIEAETEQPPEQP